MSNDSKRSGFSVNKPISKFTPRNQQKFAKGRDSDKKENTSKDKRSGSGWSSSFRSPKRTTVDWNLKVSLHQNQAEIQVGGRLKFFLENWSKITDDQWVLSIIQEGCKLEFIKKPPQSGIRKTLVSLKDTKILRQEVNILLEKDATEPVLNHVKPTVFTVHSFWCPKRMAK